MTPGVGDALVQEPGVELVVGLEAQPRGEEPTADDPDLVLDLPLLPSRSRRACCRFDQVVATHLHGAPVERALLADEDGLHRRLHVVVDASPAGTLEQPECPVVGVEHHLLARARISADEEHSAVAQPDVRDLDLGRHPRQHHVLVAPVELIGLARREHQRHIGLRSMPNGATATPWRSAAPRRSRRHSPDPRGLRRSVAASAAPASTWSRWPPASAPARPSTAPASASAGPAGRR